MKKFWELFERSVIVQATITLILVGGVVYMYIAGREPPETLLQMLFLVLGFYFGGKVENSKARTYIKRLTGDE